MGTTTRLIVALTAVCIMNGCVDENVSLISSNTNDLPGHITAEIYPEFQISAKAENLDRIQAKIVRLERQNVNSVDYIKMIEYAFDIGNISIPQDVNDSAILTGATYLIFSSALRNGLSESLAEYNKEIRKIYGRKLDVFRWNLNEVSIPDASMPMVAACTDSRSIIDSDDGRPIIRERGVHCAIGWLKDGLIDRSRRQYIVGAVLGLATEDSLTEDEDSRFEVDAMRFLASVQLK